MTRKEFQGRLDELLREARTGELDGRHVATEMLLVAAFVVAQQPDTDKAFSLASQLFLHATMTAGNIATREDVLSQLRAVYSLPQED